MMISALGYDNLPWMLVDEDGTPMPEGCEVETFRGETLVLTGGRAPHNSNSTGRINTETADGRQREYYPGVCDLRWTHVVSPREG